MKITDGINKLSEKFNAFCENKKALKIVEYITKLSSLFCILMYTPLIILLLLILWYVFSIFFNIIFRYF